MVLLRHTQRGWFRFIKHCLAVHQVENEATKAEVLALRRDTANIGAAINVPIAAEAPLLAGSRTHGGQVCGSHRIHIKLIFFAQRSLVVTRESLPAGCPV